ncbi:site-specific DNA-methyltransferase [Legionella pneumophila]|uniref:site-specific DNA-methyltransferase n=1 Tax=Legionella pneumophila TaxID=446 RepID=UPI002239212E|nr:site-specific DNA-methyltransferase [Legionella pneumophila]
MDPPFATGQDFSYTVNIGEHTEAMKIPSALEVKAYRDTWGKGTESYLQMMYDRLSIMKDLLAENGCLYVHCDWRVNYLLRFILNEIFGEENFINEIIWRRKQAQSWSANQFGVTNDSILLYTKGKDYIFNPSFSKDDENTKKYILERFKFDDGDGRKYMKSPLVNPLNRPNLRYEFHGVKPPKTGWLYSMERMEEMFANNELVMPEDKNARIYRKIYEDTYQGQMIQNIWLDIPIVNPMAKERVNYPTQKPIALLERIITTSSNTGDLIADFFCGSGTAGLAAEKLGRRWIMVDLGRFAIHTSRKRLLDINSTPFIVQNLGKYERQHWVKMNGQYTGYLKFILELYGAGVTEELVRQFRQAFKTLHGKKGDVYIHIGNVDAPVTLLEIREALQECKENNISKLVVLGWEWQLGLHELIYEEAHPYGVKLRILQIPREVMELSSNDRKKHDIQFFELACLETETKIVNKNVIVTLTDFIIPHPDLLPIEVREKISNWSDYIDYWSIDWMSNQRSYKNKTIFHSMDQQYRTRENSNLNLSMSHKYDNSGNYQILVKVIDIFGNDTTKMVEVKVS